MAKKKNIQSSHIIEMYMDYVLEHNQEPTTIYKFSKENNFDEALFYQSFSSFEAVKNAIFEAFFTATLNLLEKSDDYEHYDSRNKLLSFYFTFFENLTANRSYVVYALNNDKNKLKALKQLQGLRNHFKAFVASLEIKTIDIKQEKIQKFQQKALEESAWMQLLLTLKFWLEDSSKSFEKTDVFIEKSVNTSFDILDIAPLKSVIDLGKFLYKEKVMMT